MISAKEALKISNKAKSDKVLKEIDTVEKLIQWACVKGETEVSYHGQLSEETIESLEKEDFIVDKKFRFWIQDCAYIISWDGEVELD